MAVALVPGVLRQLALPLAWPRVRLSVRPQPRPLGQFMRLERHMPCCLRAVPISQRTTSTIVLAAGSSPTMGRTASITKLYRPPEETLWPLKSRGVTQ